MHITSSISGDFTFYGVTVFDPTTGIDTFDLFVTLENDFIIVELDAGESGYGFLKITKD